MTTISARLIASPDLRATLGKEGRERVEERHDWTLKAAELMCFLTAAPGR